MRLPASQFDNPLDVLASQADASSAIDAWLGVFARLMRLPEPARQEIRSELREHLRERVRDLTLGGCDEREAVRAAIEELGETAELARRFEAANRPSHRRMLMHATMLLASAGVIAAGIITLAPRQPALPVARFTEAAANPEAEPPKSLTDGKITLTGDNSLGDTLDHIAQLAKLNLLVNWREIGDYGVTRDDAVTMSLRDVPASQALNLLASTVGNSGNPFDWRARDGMIEFGLRHSLDAHEVELLSYDIGSTLKIIAAEFNTPNRDAAEQICDLLTSLVDPVNWADNGGDLAQMRLVGGRLFVQAPRRMQTKVQWILDQLPHAQGDAPQGRAEGVPVLKDVPIIDQFFDSRGKADTASPKTGR